MKNYDFRVRIKELRECSGYKSQKAFADVFGVAQSTVAGWESGAREPDFTTLKKLAEHFSVSADYLIGNTTEEPIVWIGENRQKKIFDIFQKAIIEKGETAGGAIVRGHAKTDFWGRLSRGTLKTAPINDIISVSRYLGVESEIRDVFSSEDIDDTPDRVKNAKLEIANQLTAKMNMLNKEGQKKVAEYIDVLVDSGRYSPCKLKDEAM